MSTRITLAILNTKIAIDDVFRCGFMTMRQVYDKIDVYLSGYVAAKKGE